MLEILEMLFVYTPIELRVIVLGCIVTGVYFHFKDIKDKKNDKNY
jgi:hypothetical protein